MKHSILFGLILFFLTLIPFIPTNTGVKDAPVQICEYDNDWEIA